MLCKPGKPSSRTEAEQPSGNKAALLVFSTAAAAQETARWRFDGTAAPEATGEILPGEIKRLLKAVKATSSTSANGCSKSALQTLVLCALFGLRSSVWHTARMEPLEIVSLTCETS